MGIVVPSWAALSSRNIPDALLGRYFGYCFAASGALAVLTGTLGAWLVAKGGLQWGYATCCASAFALQVFSIVLLAQTRPIGPAPAEPGRLLPFLRSRWKQLFSDRTFQVFALLVFCMQFAGGATQLFTTSLKDRGLPDSLFEWLNPAMAVGTMLGAFWLGHLFDRKGAWQPWLIAFAALLLSLATLVWGGTGVASLALAYLGSGLFNVVYGVVNLPWILRLAGTAQAPVFMGLMNTLIAPWCFLAPYCLGKLARSHGVNSAFAVSALAAVICIGLIYGSPRLHQKGNT